MLTSVAKAQRSFHDFAEACRDARGFEKWDDLAVAAGMGPATVYRIVTSNPADPGGSARTRNLLARALRFEDWAGMVRAWEADRTEPLDDLFSRQIQAAADEAGIPVQKAQKFLALLNMRMTHPPRYLP
jgi:hypothetical protein